MDKHDIDSIDSMIEGLYSDIRALRGMIIALEQDNERLKIEAERRIEYATRKGRQEQDRDESG